MNTTTTDDSGSCCMSPTIPARIGGRVPIDACGTELAVPVIIVNNPARACSRVDLPAPEGPSSSTFWPGSMLRLIPENAVFTAGVVPPEPVQFDARPR